MARNSNKPLKDRLTKAVLQKLHDRKMTNKEAADLYGVSETYMSRTVASLQDKRPGETTSARKAASKLFAARRQTREQLAKKVKNGELGLAAAATRANCSERTMARYVAAYTPARRQRKATPQTSRTVQAA